jgi:nucleoside-diphosphate-sugar epimerase
MGKTAFVTGGTGFVGSHLVELLLASGYDEVRCLVRTSPKWLDGMNVKLIRGELDDRDLLLNAVSGVDYVYHVGGLTRSTRWEEYYDANVRGTIRLMEAVAEANPDLRKVLITSSLALIGRSEQPIADETTPMRPISLYGRSKAQMEQELMAWTERLPLVIVRPPVVYGPREADVYTFFKTVFKGICPIVGFGSEPELSLVHVFDLVRGMMTATESDVTVGKTYFIGSDEQYSWPDIRDAVKRLVKGPVLTIRVPKPLVVPVGAVVEWIGRLFGQYPPLNREKAEEILRACKMCSSARAKADFGYSQQMPLREGIAGTIDWYKKEGWL